MNFRAKRITIETALIEADNIDEAKIRIKYGLPEYISWNIESKLIKLDEHEERKDDE